MIQVNGLTKSYGARTLFEDVSFSVGKGERIGLVGRNGAGKSTLLDIIMGTEGYDSGTIMIPKNYRLGYLDQHIHFTKPTVLEECCQVLSADEQYDYYKAEKILFGLGFSEADMEKAPDTFSGGYQLRINLTKTLLQNPDMLLLDEPTNYLDIVSLRWMRRFLRSFRGEAIIITHDRDFMDSVSTHTMGIRRNRLLKIQGQTEKYYSQLAVDDEVHEKTRIKQEKKIKELQSFVDRFKAKASKATQAQSKMKQIAKMAIFDEIEPEYQMGFSFHYLSMPSKTCMQVKDLAFSYTGKTEDNLFSNITFDLQPGDRLAVIGKNGKGKTTLLNALSGETSPTHGSVRTHPSVAIGYYQQTNRKDLNPNNTVAEEIAEANPELMTANVRAICGAMMFSGDQADKKISVLSGGEQSRVLLGKILAHPTNLLMLDEPSNHLDMDSIEIMIEEIKDFAGAVIIVTHNEEMLRELANKLIIFHKGNAEFYPGTYDEFLDSIGWEEEADLAKSGKKAAKKAQKESSQGDDKEREKALKAAKKEYAALEEQIIKTEETLREKNDEALKLTTLGGSALRINEVYKEIASLQAELEKQNKRLETLLSQMENA